MRILLLALLVSGCSTLSSENLQMRVLTKDVHYSLNSDKSVGSVYYYHGSLFTSESRLITICTSKVQDVIGNPAESTMKFHKDLMAGITICEAEIKR